MRRDYFHQLAVEKNGTDAAEKVYYPDLLVDRLVKVITQARQNLRPATLETGIAKQENLAFNRRYWMRNGKVVFNPGQMNTNIVRPAGPTDPEVSILLARDWQSGKPFAGLTVFAMHLDTAGGTEYSADYAFYLQEGLRKKFGPSYISAFGAGTCGDLNHINVNKKETTKGFEAAERIGSTLAETVLKASEHLDSVSKPSLSVRNTVLEIQLQRVSPEAVADAKSKVNKLGDPNTDFTSKVVLAKTLDLAARGPTIPMEVQVFRLDPDTAIVCLPGEIFVELGLAIKRGSPFKNTMVISICNDRPNYVPTLKAFSEGSYEVTNSRVQPGTGEQLVEAAITLLKDLKE